MNTETQPFQLRLGQAIVSEKKDSTIGIIRRFSFAVVPDEYGNGYCNAKLAQETLAQKEKGKKVWGLSGFTTLTETTATKNRKGKWKKWPIPQGTLIGTSAKSFRKRKVNNV